MSLFPWVYLRVDVQALKYFTPFSWHFLTFLTAGVWAQRNLSIRPSLGVRGEEILKWGGEGRGKRERERERKRKACYKTIQWTLWQSKTLMWQWLDSTQSPKFVSFPCLSFSLLPSPVPTRNVRPCVARTSGLVSLFLFHFLFYLVKLVFFQLLAISMIISWTEPAL